MATLVKKGGVLRPNAAITARFYKAWSVIIDQLTSETTRELTALFKQEASVFDSVEVQTAIDLGVLAPVINVMDASLADQAQDVINRLMSKFAVLFEHAATVISDAMVTQTMAVSQTDMKRSLKDISQDITLKPTEELRQMIDAAAHESAGLIKRVPVDYLPQVQGDVMRSITTGNGLADLEPALRARNVKVKNWAENVSKDQTRKVYNNINSKRAQGAGAKEFEWIHSGGSNKPRQFHLDRAPSGLNGGIFRFDNPPIIDERTGETGMPGQLPYCGCTFRPIFRFDDED